MEVKIVIRDRVFQRHPDISRADIIHAFQNMYAMRRRSWNTPMQTCMAGPDTKGRLIEVVFAEGEDGVVVVYHAMKLTAKAADELGLR